MSVQREHQAATVLAPRRDGRSPVLLLLINVDWYFTLHWLARAQAAVQAGWEVHVAAETTDPGLVRAIESRGIRFRRLPLSRKSVNPVREAASLLAIRRVIAEVRPDCLHLVTLKLVIYGGLVVGRRDLPTVYSLPGLGAGFRQGGLWQRVVRRLFESAYRRIFSRPGSLVLVENRDDLDLLVARDMVARDAIQWMPGAGIDLQMYRPAPEPETGIPVVLFAARLYRDKGLEELVEAMGSLRDTGVRVELWVAGILDPDTRGAYSRSEVETLLARPGMRWLGRVEDMPGLMRQVHIVCQPSREREGLPRVLLEGAASERALVATDVPGCREIVIDQVTGLLVPPACPARLAEAISRLVQDPALRRRLARAGRAQVERHFSDDKVVLETLSAYRRVMT